MSYDVVLDRRVALLERQQTVGAGTVQDNKWYEFQCAPSCPPDKRIHIRGGIVTASGRWGFIINNDFILDFTCDFENEPETQLNLVFSNPGYFLPLILCYYGDWVGYNRAIGPPYDLPVFENVIGTEVATAAEAEAQIDAFLNGYEQWYIFRFPLWGVVLKNDGCAGIPYAIAPIGAVNRGQSYLYRDARSNGGIFP